MAALGKEDVLKLAHLARLQLSDSEVESFMAEINDILGYVEVLQSVDVDGLEPTIQVSGLKNVTREDVVKQYQATPEGLLAVAPHKEKTSLKVKRVL